MNNNLSIRGYSILKSNIDNKKLEEIRDELTVKAYIPEGYGTESKSFKIYLEGPTKIYVPKYYGLINFGIPKNIKYNEPVKINLLFNGVLRQEQQEPINKFLDACNDPLRMGGILNLPCGYGKCLAYDTNILMYDGIIKKVQDIKIGDILMGDDSTPRNVLSLARGQEMMYEIIPVKGESFICNESHILSLKCSTNWSKSMKKGDIIDISVRDYLNLPKSFHGKGGPLLSYKVGVEFNEKKLDLDPYILGVWLGDGHSNGRGITTQDAVIYIYFQKELRKIDMYLNYQSQYDYDIVKLKKENNFKILLKQYNLIDNKHIPYDYKCNSRINRLKLLAGLIDTDGYYCKGSYEIVQKNKNLSDDILYLVRSLGFAAYQKQVKKTCTNSSKGKVTGIYHLISFYGDNLEQIPVLCQRKKASERKQIKDPLTNRITVNKLKIDNYYGFEIDKNKRFLLGDFTVTHNTAMAIYLITKLQVKTLIVVHKDFLLEQWKERIQQFSPNARIGYIKAKIIDVENKDIVIGSLQSLSMKEYNEETFKEFGLLTVDECFPYDQNIVTDKGPINIGHLYNMWEKKQPLPLIKSFNQALQKFEWKKITFAWKKQADKLLEISFDKTTIRCTPNHKILTLNGMKEAQLLKEGEIVIGNADKDFSTLKIVSIQNLEKWKDGSGQKYTNNVYDIEVEDNHTLVCCTPASIQGVVASNCHRTAAEVFSRAFQKITFRYTLGLSATIKRKDGLSKVFQWYLGDIVFSVKKRTDNVKVIIKEYYNANPNYSKEWILWNNKPNISKMINNVCEFQPRIEFIKDIIKEIIETEPDRKILVLSDRRGHLENLHEILLQNEISCGLYYGGLKAIILKENEKKQVILGTFAIASEGLDISGLDTLILASPKSDIVQSSGRILRTLPECRVYQPLIIDIVDNISVFPNQAKKRLAYYKSCKYELEEKKKSKEIVKNGTCYL